MSKLLKLKEWVTVPKAAEHLSNILKENVCEADVLRLALDGRLKLSVNFVNRAKAICGKVVPSDQAKCDIWSRKEGVLAPLEAQLSEDEINKGLDDGSLIRLIDIGYSVKLDNGVLELDDKICKLNGVYDLPMIGAEKLDIEHRCQQLTGGPVVTLICLQGLLVEDHDGQLYQVQEHFSNNEYYKDENLAEPYDNPRNYYPARTLPSDGVLVVRTSALRAFEQQHISSISPKTADTKEIPEKKARFYINEPTKKDDWFYAIKECAEHFVNENSRLPTEAELWLRMFSNPPPNYPITIDDWLGHDRKPVLELTGGPDLTRDAFRKRYKNYFPRKTT